MAGDKLHIKIVKGYDMKSRMWYILLLLSVVGCTTSIDELAKNGSWSDIGYRDGIKGLHSRSFSSLQELGNANQADYEQGYLQGVIEYCNPDHAYQIGLSGSYYEGVCEGTENAQKFRMEWQRGWNEAN